MDHNEQSLDFSKSLLYSLNNEFIEGNIAEPQNAQEIRANLESRLGSTQSTVKRWGGLGLGFVLLFVNLIFAFVVLVIVMIIVGPDAITDRMAGLILLLGYVVGRFIITRLTKRLLGDRLTIAPVSALKPDTAYKALVDNAEVVNGNVVDVVTLMGDTLITYSVKTPKLQTIQRSYKTSSTRYTRDDVGKEVAVLYFDETVNVLL